MPRDFQFGKESRNKVVGSAYDSSTVFLDVEKKPKR